MTAHSAEGRVVALLGAESTGKTTLARALAARFAALPGWQPADVGWVPEVLRSFCETHGRTPRADEQAGIARQQAECIAEARRRHRVVIADTTGVMVAVYSRFIFGDESLHEEALRAHREGVDVTLVTGLDLPWVADGDIRDGPHVREPVDRLLRRALAGGGIDYAVVQGTGAAREVAAWRALAPLRRRAGWPDGDERIEPETGTGTDSESGSPADPATRPLRWRAMCECCADPAAEAADFRRRRPTRR